MYLSKYVPDSATTGIGEGVGMGVETGAYVSAGAGEDEATGFTGSSSCTSLPQAANMKAATSNVAVVVLKSFDFKAGAFTERFLHLLLVKSKAIIRHQSLYTSGESAAVNTPGAFSFKQLGGELESVV